MKQHLRDAIQQHATAVDSVLEKFALGLDRVVATAQSALQRILMQTLKLDADLVVQKTSGNLRVLRSVPKLWEQAVDDAGWGHVLETYLRSYPEQIPAFLDLIHAVNYDLKEPLPVPVFSKTDQNYLAGLTLSSGSDLSAMLETTAITTVSRAAFSVGMTTFDDLLDHVFVQTPPTVSKVNSLADTSIAGFYRTVAAIGYEKIQKATGQELRYAYYGPLDRLNREFCHKLLKSKRIYTKEQAMQMNNGQGLDVWQWAGGFRCRHQHVLVPTQ